MSDVFISYSRRDSPFVRKLYDALKERDLDVWVDFEGIPPSAEWRQEIASAIQGADAFVFVLSPDSAASKVCGEELAEALKYQKRLIPVIRRTVSSKDVAPELAKLNWVYFREEDDAVKATGLVVDAIRTDLPWVKMHTRLLTRALEWEANRREGGYLLRGKDLADAEAWLSGAAGKDPPPQMVQTQYILASRALAIRRTRALLGAITMALVVSVGLTVYALLQRSSAINEARIALSRQLAVQATTLVEERRDQAFLLAAEASALDDSPATRAALMAALYRDPRLLFYAAPPLSGLRSVAAGPGGGRFAAGGVLDVTAALYDAETGLPAGLLAGAGPDLSALTFTQDGSRIIGGFQDGTVLTWDTTSLQLLPLTPTMGDPPEVTALAAGMARAYSVGKQGTGYTISAWDLDSGMEVQRVPSPPITLIQRVVRNRQAVMEPRVQTAGLKVIALSADGGHLALADNMGDIFLMDTGSFESRTVIANRAAVDLPEGTQAITVSGGADALAFSPDGRFLAIGMRDEVILYHLHDGGVTRVADAKDSTALAFSPNSRILAAGAAGGSVQLWEVREQEPIGPVMAASRRPVSEVAFHADGGRLLVATEDGAVGWWDTGGWTGVARRVAETHLEDDLLVWTAPDGGRSIAWNRKRMEFVDLATGSRLGAVDTGEVEYASRREVSGVDGLGFSPDGSLFAGAFNDGATFFWETAGGKRYDLINDFEGYPDVVFSADGRTVAIGSRSLIVLRDLEARRELHRHDLGKDSLSALAISADGRLIAWGTQFRVGVWDTGAEAPGNVITAASGWVRSLAFSPDGETLLVGTEDNAVSTRVVATLEVLHSRTIGNLAGRPSRILFSPDGSVLAGTVGHDTMLWDAATHLPLVLIQGSAPIRGMTFGDGGETLIVSYTFAYGERALALSYSVGAPALRNAACRAANRRLDEQEWSRLVGGRAYQPYCSGPAEAP